MLSGSGKTLTPVRWRCGPAQANHPNRLSRANPRALQRRVQHAGIMANKLVYAASESPPPELIGLRDLALAMGDPRR